MLFPSEEEKSASSHNDKYISNKIKEEKDTYFSIRCTDLIKENIQVIRVFNYILKFICIKPNLLSTGVCEWAWWLFTGCEGVSNSRDPKKEGRGAQTLTAINCHHRTLHVNQIQVLCTLTQKRTSKLWGICLILVRHVRLPLPISPWAKSIVSINNK